MKRLPQLRAFVQACTLITCVAGSALVLSGCGEDPVNETNFAQIKVGMTLHEVETIMGGAGEREETPTGMSISGAGVAGASSNNVERFIWRSGPAMISVEVRDNKIASVGRVGF